MPFQDLVTDRPLPKWPESYAKVYQDVLPSSLLNDILQDSGAHTRSPNYWLPKDFISTSEDLRLSKHSAEAAIQLLYRDFLSKSLPEGDFAGAEWWVQDYERGKGLAFHFDKDEALFKEHGRMEHPLLSSVLYLTGSGKRARLGPTVIVEQLYDNASQQAVPDLPQRSAIVWPRRNSFCIFDGRLAHGVLESPTHGRRVTLLINWWTYKPQGVDRAPPCSLPDREPPPCESGCEDSDGKEHCDGGIRELGTQASIAVINAPCNLEPQAIPIDDLLEAYNLSCTGPDAVHAVAIAHSCFQLYPVGADQSEQSQRLSTAAALVSPELLEDSGCSEEDDSVSGEGDS